MQLALELAIAGLYLIGAAFNAGYTLRNASSFYGAFADGAWLVPARRLIRGLVIPNAIPFTLALIGFQLTVAVLILARGDAARVGLIAGAAFSAAAALVSSPRGSAANLALAALQAWLAATG